MNLYPDPCTVTMNRGSAGRSPIFFRSFATCMSTVRAKRIDIQRYTWRVDGVVREDQASPSADLWMLAPGAHLVEVVVTDTFGLADTAAWSVTVADGAAPQVVLGAEPGTLPIDGRMHAVAVTASVSDGCGFASDAILVSARSSDPETCAGGEASPDVVAETGTGARAVELRGEVCAGRASRTYTLVYEARDAAGNVGTAQVAVVVSR